MTLDVNIKNMRIPCGLIGKLSAALHALPRRRSTWKCHNLYCMYSVHFCVHFCTSLQKLGRFAREWSQSTRNVASIPATCNSNKSDKAFGCCGQKCMCTWKYTFWTGAAFKNHSSAPVTDECMKPALPSYGVIDLSQDAFRLQICCSVAEKVAKVFEFSTMKHRFLGKSGHTLAPYSPFSSNE